MAPNDNFSTTMTRKIILEEAEHCVCGDRDEVYGSPENNFATISALWSDYLRTKLHDTDIRLEKTDVAVMMILLKISRISSGHGKSDNWIDIAGYAACGGEIDA